MNPANLTEKYNVAAPRYTSYPTMPYWDTANFNIFDWEQAVTQTFELTNRAGGISLYIHLPFCENLCTYCGCNTRITKNHRVEVPYINAILKEWKMYKELMDETPVIREMHLGGGTPTFFSADNLQLLIQGILNGAAIHPQAEFSFEAHPDNTTIDHLETLYDLGFKRLSLGIQDFDPKVQFIINRQQSFEKVQVITQQARRIGYTSINYDLIYGLPLQTFAGLTQTLKLVAELKPERIAFYSYAHVPWLKPGKRRFTEHDLPDAAAKSLLYETGRELLKNHGYLEVGMDHFALPDDTLFNAERSGKLHRNFMGYTHHHTQLLIGLGVSSISDAGTAFSQNVKVVDDYLRLIDENKLPILKGHLLTGEDMIIRRHILNIMCRGITTWDTTVETFILTAIERLEPLAADGLIKLHVSGLEVTKQGRNFLRNICMALDERLWKAQPESQQFSMSL
ncbi:oxygen-independent coproporphyrinogen III oxidase [Mucilaginibacter sp.]|uniref:oxygen-independent coproporphyrinogen III oxidase n=1 Tax=Mucilaginibacter sp. TaxID=1882438 RepID=UPI003D15336B